MYTEREFVDLVKNLSGAKILKSDNKVYLLEVTKQYACGKLFNRKTIDWCIARSKSHWNDYITNPGNKQYFIVDFNNVNSNRANDYNNSFIGFTVNNKGDIYAAHARDDKNLLGYSMINGDRLFEHCLKEKGLYKYVIEDKMKDNVECQASMLPFYFLVSSILLAMCSLLIKW
jgi:hypothetical protein